jgi:sugar/nucleoside kinase (ribokinase family)
MTVAYGTVCLDRTYSLPHLPIPGGYVEVLEERTLLGGEAANTAAAIRRWGGDVTLVGNPLGVGAEAKLLTRLLHDAGLADAVVPPGDHPAPVCHIMVTPDGERTMFGRGFAEMEHRGDPSLAPMRAGDWFTADPNHGALARKAVLTAHEKGMHTYALDFVRDSEELPIGCFWQSSTSWVGVPGDEAANRRWLENWLARHDCTAILTDGGNGILLGDRAKGVRRLPVWPIERLVDSTGAGDVFRAGVLLGLDEGRPIAESLAFAAAAAALNCLALGAIAGLTDRPVVEAFVEAHPEIAAQYSEAV